MNLRPTQERILFDFLLADRFPIAPGLPLRQLLPLPVGTSDTKAVQEMLREGYLRVTLDGYQLGPMSHVHSELLEDTLDKWVTWLTKVSLRSEAHVERLGQWLYDWSVTVAYEQRKRTRKLNERPAVIRVYEMAYVSGEDGTRIQLRFCPHAEYPAGQVVLTWSGPAKNNVAVSNLARLALTAVEDLYKEPPDGY